MKLPLPFFQSKKEEESDYFLALLLTDEKTSAVILQESLGVLKVLSKHEEFFHLPLEDTSLEDLISLVDKTISKAEEILPPDIQTHKTVFGVKDTWVETETKKISKDNLAKLKKVCDSLDLTPIGFMVVTEAISHLLQKEEGAPVSAILTEVGKKTITLSLLRGGKVVERIDGPLEESASATVDTLLKHFTTAVLPARIILYDSKDVEHLSQQFIGHQWSKSLPFLHVPQITVLPSGFDAKAVTFGAASQMGFDVAGLDAFPKVSNTHTTVKEDVEETEPNEEREIKETISNTSTSRRSSEEDSGQDGTDKEPFIPSGASVSTETPPISGDNFGFVTDQDITTTKPLPKTTVSHQSSMHEESNISAPHNFPLNLHQKNEDEEIENDTLEKPKWTNPLAILARLGLPKITLPSIPAMNGRRKFILPIGILIGLVIMIVGFSFYYYNSVQAHIVLSVKPKIVDQDAKVIFAGTSASDFSKDVIAAKTVETSVDGSLTIDTTGKKDVGNKAKGTVTLYNNSSGSIKLENGTAIKSSNGLTFLLDKDVSIASASGDIFSGTKPGTTDVAVTARDIGTESNLPSGTKFTIGSNSSLAAKNDSAFSGGSKKQVQVVSKNDVAKLRNDLPKSLEDKARDAISQKADSDMTLLPLITVVRLDKPKFDNDVDDEAKKVTLTATVIFSALTYENDELNNYAKSLLKGKYSQDISDKSIKNTISDPEETDDEQVEAKLAIQAGLLPDIDTEDVLSKVENLSLQNAKELLNGLPQVAESQITFSPSIPLLPNFFPRLPNQVSIEVKPE